MTDDNPTPRRRQQGRGAAVADQRRAAAQRRDARRRTAGLAAAAVAVAAIVVLALARSGDSGDPGGSGDEAATAAPAGTETFDDLSQNHVPGNVSYPQTPPVGGNHNPEWQNCGFYSQPIMPEKGVHTMEHGAVWVTYRPDLPSEQITALQRLAQAQTYILASAWPGGLPAPVVASAWGRQLTLTSAGDPELAAFVRAFRQGPQTPEPGAPCTGGESGTG